MIHGPAVLRMRHVAHSETNQETKHCQKDNLCGEVISFQFKTFLMYKKPVSVKQKTAPVSLFASLVKWLDQSYTCLFVMHFVCMWVFLCAIHVHLHLGLNPKLPLLIFIETIKSKRVIIIIITILTSVSCTVSHTYWRWKWIQTHMKININGYIFCLSGQKAQMHWLHTSFLPKWQTWKRQSKNRI